MPVLPQATGAIRWEAHYRIGDDTNIVNVLHLATQSGAAVSQAQLNVIAGVAVAAWDAQLFAGLSTDAAMDHHVFTDLFSPVGPQTILLDATAGAVASASAPPSTCLVIQERTGTRGRSYRGRVYLAGVPKADITSPQHWDAATAETFEDAFEAIQTAVQGAATPCDIGVVSYYGPPTVKAGSIAPGNPKRAHSTLRAAGIVTHPCTFSAQTRIGSQRRRNQ